MSRSESGSARNHFGPEWWKRTFAASRRGNELSIWPFRPRTPPSDAFPHLRNVIEPLEKESGIYQRTLAGPDRNWACCMTPRLRRETSREQTGPTACLFWLVV